MFYSVLFMITFFATGIPTALLFIPWCWLTGNVLPLYKGTRFMFLSSCRMGGVRFRAVGREAIPANKACIFMVNHVSNLDPPVMIALIPGRTSAFLKRSLMEIPVLGTGFKQGEFIPVDRKGSPAEAQASVARAVEVLKRGVHMMTFVEGTRSRDGRLLPFKKGPFYLAMASGAPVVPVSIYGTEQCLLKGSLKLNAGDVHVTFHPAIDPAKYASREELMRAVRTAIASGLPEWMRPDDLKSAAAEPVACVQ